MLAGRHGFESSISPCAVSNVFAFNCLIRFHTETREHRDRQDLASVLSAFRVSVLL